MATYGRAIQFDGVKLRRGNADSITLNFNDGGSPMNLTGKTLVFRAEVDGIVIRNSVAGASNGITTFTFSATDTRSIPAKRPMPCEVENLTDQKTIWEGVLIGEGGVNDD